MAKVLLKPKGWPTSRLKRFCVFGLDLVVNLLRIARGLLFQNRGERGAGVFRVDINAAAEDGLMADVASGKIEAAFDGEVGFIFDLLRDDFAEDKLFGEVLGADDDAISAWGSAGCEQCDERESENGAG